MPVLGANLAAINSRHHRFAFWLLPALTMLGGCETLDDIKIRDAGALARSGSVIIRPERFDHGRGGRGGVEFDYEQYRATSSQAVAADRYAFVGGTKFPGPVTLQHRLRTEVGRIAYNHLLRFGPHFELEPSLGVTYERMKFTTQSQTGSAGVREEAFGLGFGLMPRFVMNRVVGVEGRVKLMLDEKGDYSFTRRLALTISPVHNIVLRGGYYWRDADKDSYAGYSDIESYYDGPLASVTLRF